MRGGRHDEQPTPATGLGEAPDEGRRAGDGGRHAICRRGAADGRGCRMRGRAGPRPHRGSPELAGRAGRRARPPAARACAAAGLPRRPGVVVAVSGEPPPEAWRHAVAVGAAEHADLRAGGGTLAGRGAGASRGGRRRRRRGARRRRWPRSGRVGVRGRDGRTGGAQRGVRCSSTAIRWGRRGPRPRRGGPGTVCAGRRSARARAGCRRAPCTRPCPHRS